MSFAAIEHLAAPSPAQEQQLDCVRDMMTADLVLDEDAFRRNLNTATPGDPQRVFMHDGTPYSEAAYDYMHGHLDDFAAQVGISAASKARTKSGITRAEYRAIEHEIRFQHDAQCKKNQRSYDTLLDKYQRGAATVDEWRAIFVKLARSVYSDTIQRLCLLDWYPELGSIEDMKRTCLGDAEGREEAIEWYLAQLRSLPTRTKGRFAVTIIRPDNHEARPRDLRGIADKGVYAEKVTLARITDTLTDIVYDSTMKTGYYDFPVTRHLEGVHPNIVDGVNRQAIYIQAYLHLEESQLFYEGRPHDIGAATVRAASDAELWEAYSRHRRSRVNE